MTVREDAKINNKDFVLAENYDSSTDLVRQNIDSYWTDKFSNGKKIILNPDAPFKFYQADGKSGNKANMEIEEIGSDEFEPFFLLIPGTDIVEVIEIPIYSEKVTLTPNLDLPIINVSDLRQSPQSVFEDFAEQLRESYSGEGSDAILGPYSDHYLEIDAPIMYSSNINNRSLIVGEVEYTFNYGNENYESSISSATVLEKRLLNFYKYFGDKETRTQYSTFYDKDTKTTKKLEVIVTPDPLDPSRENALASLKSSATGLFIENVADYFITKENFKDSSALLENVDIFPFFAKISFGNPPGNAEEDDFRSAIYDGLLATAFCDIMNQEISTLEDSLKLDPESPVVSTPFISTFLSSSYLDEKQEDYEEIYQIQENNLKVFDALKILRKMYEAPISTDPTEESSIYKNFSEEASFTKNNLIGPLSDKTIETSYLENLDKLKEEYQKLLDENSRSYKDVVLGVKPYTSKALFYRIAKFEIGSITPIQNFWIPAENTYLGLNYIDSQVKYGKKYRYKIFAYKMEVGSEYAYQEQISILEASYGASSFGDEFSIVGGTSGFLEESFDEMQKLKFIAEIRDTISDLGIPNADAIADAFIAQSLVEIGSTSKEGFFGLRTSYQKNIQPYTDFIRSILNTGTGVDRFGNEILKEEIDPVVLGRFEDIVGLETNIYGSKGFGSSTVPGTFKDIDRAGGLLDFVQWNTRVSKFLSEFRDIVLSREDFSDFDEGTAAAISGALGGASLIVGGGIGTVLAGVGLLGALLIDLVSNAIKRGNIQKDAKNKNFDRLTSFRKFDNTIAYSMNLFDTDDKDKEKKLSFAEIQSGLDEFSKRIRILEGHVKDFVKSQEEYFDLVNLSFTVEKAFDKLVYSVFTKPSLKLIEIPYYESVGTILDNPPLFPNINFVTYRGIDDKISFFMNSGQGSLEQAPIIFSEEEENFYKTFREARKLTDFQEILFISDEFENLASAFEIRRLASPPESYEDFKNSSPQIITKTLEIGEKSPSASFLDNITPNKKYYYMFRVFDRRGIASNPTPVYEIELVENSGAIYPLIRSYDFPEGEQKINKSFKRLFNIVPRISQILPRESSPETYADLSRGETSILGTEEEALFGKTFKIRLSSKKTGKVVDLNVNFKSTVHTTLPEVEK